MTNTGNNKEHHASCASRNRCARWLEKSDLTVVKCSVGATEYLPQAWPYLGSSFTKPAARAKRAALWHRQGFNRQPSLYEHDVFGVIVHNFLRVATNFSFPTTGLCPI